MEKVNRKVLILGSTGMIGHQVFLHLSKFSNYTIYDISSSNIIGSNTIILDLMEMSLVKETLDNIRPEFIINCAGVLINESDKNQEKAIYLNAYLPHQLETISRNINAKLIHISTDCVFSGKKGKYIESDFKDGQDIYAKSKGLGEIINNKDLTIRTSTIGPELKDNGEGLFHWFMMQEGSIKGYTKAFWSGITTIELAKVIHVALEQNLSGLYHATNGNKISKFELLSILKNLTGKNITIIPEESKFFDKSFIDTRKDLKYTIPSYKKMIQEMIAFIISNQALYPSYSFQ